MTDDGARPNEPEHLVVGHISKVHGTKGEVVVWPLTDRPDSVFAPRRELLLGDSDGNVSEHVASVLIEESRPFKKAVLVKIDGFDARSTAEALVGLYLLAPIDELEPLDEGEVFYHQLLGMQVDTKDGENVGSVREVFETAPTHLLEVVAEDGKVRLIPFAEHIVKDVDVDARRITIDPPAGLLDI